MVLDELAAALEGFDEPRAQAILDRLLAETTLDAFLSEIVMPYLHDLGDRWERGEITVAQEHFASNVLRGRLLGLARTWGRGVGPRALLACAPGEQHELGLIAFGLALRAQGWRIEYLGADTPLETVDDVAESLAVDLVVVSAVTPERIGGLATQLGQISQRRRLAIGGAGAEAVDATALGALALIDDPVREAERVTALVLAPEPGPCAIVLKAGARYTRAMPMGRSSPCSAHAPLDPPSRGPTPGRGCSGCGTGARPFVPAGASCTASRNRMESSCAS